MAQLDKVRLPDGRIVHPTHWTSTPLYSTVEIAEGNIQKLFFFSYGNGGDVPGSVGPRKANLRDTNFRGQGGQLQEAEELLLFSVMLELFVVPATLSTFWSGAENGTPDPPDVSLRNVLRFQRRTTMQLRIAESKNFLDHPVSFFPAAMGVRHYTSAARPLDVAAINSAPILGGHHGTPASYDNRRLGTPHKIMGGEVFSISLDFPDGAVTSLDLGDDADARLRVRAYADGYRQLPVA